MVRFLRLWFKVKKYFFGGENDELGGGVSDFGGGGFFEGENFKVLERSKSAELQFLPEVLILQSGLYQLCLCLFEEQLFPESQVILRGREPERHMLEHHFFLVKLESMFIIFDVGGVVAFLTQVSKVVEAS